MVQSKTSRCAPRKIAGYLRERPLNSEQGFTLLELAFVVLLIAIVAGLSAGRFESVQIWKQKGDIRKFVDTWEFLYSEALHRGEAYRLIIDLDENTYYVRREVQTRGRSVQQVDYLKNLRTQGEKKRRAEEERENTRTLTEEYAELDERESGSLEALYYERLYGDPEGPIRLGVPLEHPSLAQPKALADGLRFRDVKMQTDTVTEGQVYIRFSPRGASNFAVVHLAAGDEDDYVFTAIMNPSTGVVSVTEGDIDFDWTLDDAA